MLDTAHTIAGAAARYERDKTKSAQDIMVAKQIVKDFRAFGIDSYGAMGPDAASFLAMLAEHAQQYEVRRSYALNWAAPRYLDVARQYISVALQGAIGRQLRQFAGDKRQQGARGLQRSQAAVPPPARMGIQRRPSRL